MREHGRLIKIISSQIAEVAFERTASCGKCNLCHDIDQKFVGIEALNIANAKVGNLVELYISSKSMTKATLMVFIFPLICLFVSYLITAALFQQESVAIVISLLSFASGFYLVNLYDKRIEHHDDWQAKIVKII